MNTPEYVAEAKVHISKEHGRVIADWSSQLEANGEKWMYMPWWWKQNEDGSWDVVLFHKLPQYVKDEIHKMRGEEPSDLEKENIALKEEIKRLKSK